MTRRGSKSDLGAALGSLRRERAGEVPTPVPVASPVGRPETREAFTSRLRPSQRRYLKRLAGDWEDEAGRRVTVEDILDVLVGETQDSEQLRTRLLARLISGT